MLVHVNREWERLFGYTQAELRALLIKDGMRALYRLTRLDSMQSSHRVAVDAMLAGNTDYRSAGRRADTHAWGWHQGQTRSIVSGFV